MNREQVTTTLHWTGDWPWYVGLGLAAVLALTAFILYRRDARSGFLGLLLPGLRAGAIFLIVVMLAGPVLHHRKVIGELARLIVCIDSSDSMQLTDASMDAGRKIAVAKRLGYLDQATTALELPTAAERLADARSMVASLAAIDPAAAGGVIQQTRADFAARVSEAEALFEKAGGDRDALNRFKTELAAPTATFAKAPLSNSDERARMANDLTRLGDLAGRWSTEVSEVFQRKLDQDPAAVPIKTAISRVDSLPRWQRLQALLLEGKESDRILPELARKHDVQVVLLENGVVKQFWQPGGEKPAMPTALPATSGEITDLTSGLKFAAGDQTRSEKGAVILFSDGQHNSGEAPLDTARVLAGRKMPVYTVGLGSQVAPRDLAVLRVIVPDSVFHEDRVRGEVVLKEEVPAGLPFVLTIKDGEKNVIELPLISEGKAQRRVPFEFEVKELADARLKGNAANPGYEVLGATVDLRAVVSGLEGDREPSNNESALRFRAVTQKRKILLLDGRPRWETRYLRNLFQRDEKWEVNLVMAGSTNDAGFIRGDKEGTFPTDAKLLESYDMIVFGEVPKSALKDEELKWLADFVEKRGGAILFIDGSRGTLRQYGETPLGPMIPVEWPAGGTGLRGGVKSLALTERASALGAFALTGDLGTNAETWTKLPAPHWLSGGQPLAGAEVLVEAETASGKLAAAVMRPFGAGRVYYQGFDDSWRWRYEVADLYHVKFWNQLASFVAEAPFAARDKYVQVDAGQLTYQPGAQADLRARLRGLDGKPVTEAAVSAVLSKNGTKVATIPMSADEGGLFRGKTAALEPGDYEMAIETAALPEGEVKAKAQFKVTARESLERTMLALNEDLLRQVSMASGGEYFREEKASDLLAKLAPLSSGEVIESDTVLWQSWWWFLPIVALLTVEWIIRKRAGML
jgi:hypothetical protein